MNIRKAFAVVELVVVISLFVVGAFTGVKYFGKTAGSVKGTPIENVQKIEDKKAADDAKAQGKIDVETQSQLNTAQAGAHATVEAINQADIKNTAGQNPSREIKTAKEVAQMTQDAIDAGLNQPVDPKLMKWFMDVINKKNSDIERERQIGESMLQIKSNELIASTEREAQVRAEKAASDITWNSKLTAAEAARDQWSLENAVKAQKLDRMYLIAYAVGGIWILGILLPIIAKVFPGISPVANAVSSIVGPMVQYGKSKADTLATDMVALQDKSKQFVASIDPTKVEQYKAAVSAWWEGDTHSQGVVEDIKKKLRL